MENCFNNAKKRNVEVIVFLTQTNNHKSRSYYFRNSEIKGLIHHRGEWGV